MPLIPAMGILLMSQAHMTIPISTERPSTSERSQVETIPDAKSSIERASTSERSQVETVPDAESSRATAVEAGSDARGGIAPRTDAGDDDCCDGCCDCCSDGCCDDWLCFGGGDDDSRK